MEKIKKFEKKMIKQLNYYNVDVLYNKCARNYVLKNGLKINPKTYRGFIDIDSYFKDPDKKIYILIFNTKSKFVYGTIAHEFKHAEQLLNGRIQPDTDKGKFKCEIEAYKAGMIELSKQGVWISVIYALKSVGGLINSFYRYKITSIFKRNRRWFFYKSFWSIY